MSAVQPDRGKILVVDDDRLVLATLTHGLSQAGYEVVDADNGDDAILLAREHRPALALLDIRMEGKSGFDVAAYLRDHLQIPFMFLSAFSDDETVRKVKELGAVAYLVKPVDIRQIVPAVEAAFTARPSPAPVSPAPAAAAGDAALNAWVAIAVGIAMHRFSVNRREALQRLQKLAQQGGLTLEEQSRRFVEALEMLSAPGGLG
ncbi:response regulator [Caldimonas brevitalea]|uniref:Response regulator n=1 Tax=Caldimonas brevitalea TaxID=413882 RepID=A0A0G3BSI3_9BURK|nr:response regulator [Caldimonas brevitalea]AKJ30963.1 response regulator [Caldimonas brevitalea]